eukprot:CAMPEP_0206236382 /NCGR_PEP_ID=MMETSP0047_2-20121206/13686_1 /ASSEMBLY_ACC=CAM_ASM_000192 /TAXON_ID=195065 /ORGANISM="Chroomonas mesostigmatica_cf, Strain CCMP1168" /LENGTH=215 /DNA_ID=CAMNT_0053660715 /DNA_START=193 /DNA_END=843 /DNA_ORIENTATION=-
MWRQVGHINLMNAPDSTLNCPPKVQPEAHLHRVPWQPLLHVRALRPPCKGLASRDAQDDFKVRSKGGVGDCLHRMLPLWLPYEQECVADVLVRCSVVVYDARVHVRCDSVNDLDNVALQDFGEVSEVPDVAESVERVHHLAAGGDVKRPLHVPADNLAPCFPKTKLQKVPKPYKRVLHHEKLLRARRGVIRDLLQWIVGEIFDVTHSFLYGSDDA